MKRSSQRGVALVVTLIMLTVITVIAVAFLAVTHRERAAVKQKNKSTDAEYAANSGLERVKAQILAYFGTNVTRSNGVGPDFFVSQDYINRLGFNGSLPPGTLTNASYWYANGSSVTGNDALQNLANLLLDPRPPVYINTNRTGQSGSNDFRYFLDLNRNGRFEETGFLPVVAADGQFFRDANGIIVTNYFTGDPQWIGILEYPNRPHWTDNYFIGRYAYLVVPIGRTLDINWIHNQGLDLDMRLVPRGAGGNTGIGYSRNQGFGTWELNLAALLTDVNPFQWNTYQYNPGNPNGSSGNSFADATELLRYRYTQLGIPWLYPNQNVPPQSPHLYLDFVSQVLPGLGGAFTNDLVDGFGSGPANSLGAAYQRDPDATKWLTFRWPGSDSRQHFYTVQDFFDPAKSAFFEEFRNNLTTASTNNGTTNRYTYYNLLSVLGTDSTPEPDGRININYTRNPDGSITNWTADEFFNTVAVGLMQEEYPSNVFNGRLKILIAAATPTNIITGVSNYNAGRIMRIPFYSQRVHQLLQLAANIWEATVVPDTAKPNTLYPTVFRPQLTEEAGITYITGYTVDNGAISAALTGGSLKMRDLENPADHLQGTGDYAATDLFYGIPLIISAKMGFPNFNELAVQSSFTANRRLQFVKANGWQNPVTHTNQLLLLTLTNSFGVEAWNSYQSNAYSRPISLYCFSTLLTTLADQGGTLTNFVSSLFVNTNYTSWPAGRLAASFKVPTIMVNRALTNAVYYQSKKSLNEILGPGAPPFEPIGHYTNRLALALTNRLLFVLYEGNRIIDFVSFGRLGDTFDIGEALTNQTTTRNPWSEQIVNGVQEGILNQIQVSIGQQPSDARNWSEDPIAGQNLPKAFQDLRVFLGVPGATNNVPLTNDMIQATYSARGRHERTWSWEVNDPLVHYTELDLRKASTNKPSTVSVSISRWLGIRNGSYNPWLGGEGQSPEDDVRNKDPGVGSSDQWAFPAQKLPNIGWLGRVHRGTPWQTIYLKSTPSDDWTSPQGLDRLVETHPTNDWRLLDIFTTALHPNATRGQLSVNQTNVAAWSAVFSGVPVSTLLDDNDKNPIYQDYFIEPAAKHEALRAIVDGINAQRTNLPGGQFTKLSQFVATPELTSRSPFIDPNFGFVTGTSAAYIGNTTNLTAQSPLVDSDYERIPQQILSLVKVGGEARYAVYAFGQSLRPARNSIYTGTGPFHGICQNYEITGEVATRAIVRVDFEKPPPTRQPDYTRPHAVVESFNILPTD